MNTEDKSTNKKMRRSELILYKKDCLLSELVWTKDANALRYLHAWRVRFYLGTITAAFLGFTIISNENLSLIINSGMLLTLGIILVAAFSAYDCHITDLSRGHVERSAYASRLLLKIPIYSREELERIETHVSTRKSYNEQSRRERYIRKLSHIKTFEFLLFYGTITFIWVIIVWIRSGYFAIWR